MEQFQQIKGEAVEVLKEGAQLSRELETLIPIGEIQQEFRRLQNSFEEVAEMIPREQLIIGVVAPVSSGKSTFLNGLIFGELVLDSRIGETTAALYRIRHGEEYQVVEGGRSFPVANLEELKEQIKRLNRERLELIKERGGLSREEMEVEIQLPDQRLLHTTLLDTPGYGSLNEEAMEKILEQVSMESDGIVVILDISKGLMEKDRQFLEALLQRNFIHDAFFILNKMDGIIDSDELELKSPEEIGEEIEAQVKQVVEELEKIIEKSPNSFPVDHQKIFPMSAKKALVGKKLIKEGREEEGRQRLEESRFLEFEEQFWPQLVEIKGRKEGSELARGRGLLEELEEVVQQVEVQREESRRRLERLEEVETLLYRAESALNNGEFALRDGKRRELLQELLGVLRERLEVRLSEVGWSLGKEEWERATKRAIDEFGQEMGEKVEEVVDYIQYEIGEAKGKLERASHLLAQIKADQLSSLQLSHRHLPSTQVRKELSPTDLGLWGGVENLALSIGAGVGVGLVAELIAGRLIAFAIPGIGWILGAATALFAIFSAGDKKDDLIEKIFETAPQEVDKTLQDQFNQLKSQLEGVRAQMEGVIFQLRREVEELREQERSFQELPANLVERVSQLKERYPF
jgi:GTPase Era involved in 16S rRNA processing